MKVAVPPRVLVGYAVAWAYLALFTVTDIVFAFLSPNARLALQNWASTNVVNLRNDPVGSLVASAFVPSDYTVVWPVLIAVAMFGANKALGNWRTALVCAAGHVVGTLVSEGIADYRILHGLVPQAESRIIDVGPSYVVVSAIVAAVLYGPWPVKIAAVLDLALLVAGGIFDGLSTLQVAAVGHVTAIVTAVILSSVLSWRLRHRSPDWRGYRWRVPVRNKRSSSRASVAHIDRSPPEA